MAESSGSKGQLDAALADCEGALAMDPWDGRVYANGWPIDEKLRKQYRELSDCAGAIGNGEGAAVDMGAGSG